jgi:glycerophosphoryl diester phosphodiesterase
MRSKYLIVFLLPLMISCNKVEKESLFIPKDIVIAHRGTTYWAPEETEAAYRWARDKGAHYLEVDIQRSKDGVLMALHDNQLTRTTNITEMYPERADLPSSEFTFEELMQLDAGSWCSSKAPLKKTGTTAIFFDRQNSQQYQIFEEVYIGGVQQILCLEDVIRIAEGFRIAKDAQGQRLYEKSVNENRVSYQFFYVKDTADTDNRPGVYIETKEPHLFPGVEKDLFKELDRLGWNQLTHPRSDTTIEKNGKIRVGETSARIILQTFSPESLKEINTYFKGQVPVTFLLWLGDPNMPGDDSLVYHRNLQFAKANGAHIIGPSIGGAPNNYSDLLKSQHYQWIRQQGFLIHPYSFDTQQQTLSYGERSDGMFTNRAEITLDYYQKNKSHPK